MWLKVDQNHCIVNELQCQALKTSPLFYIRVHFFHVGFTPLNSFIYNSIKPCIWKLYFVEISEELILLSEKRERQKSNFILLSRTRLLFFSGVAFSFCSFQCVLMAAFLKPHLHPLLSAVQLWCSVFIVHNVFAMTNKSITTQPCVVVHLSRLWVGGT